jgi:hypothetical protein
MHVHVDPVRQPYQSVLSLHAAAGRAPSRPVRVPMASEVSRFADGRTRPCTLAPPGRSQRPARSRQRNPSGLVPSSLAVTGRDTRALSHLAPPWNRDRRPWRRGHALLAQLSVCSTTQRSRGSSLVPGTAYKLGSPFRPPSRSALGAPRTPRSAVYSRKDAVCVRLTRKKSAICVKMACPALQQPRLEAVGRSTRSARSCGCPRDSLRPSGEAHRLPRPPSDQVIRGFMRRSRVRRQPVNQSQSYLICIPEIAREITSCWISAVPSKMS